MIGTIGEIRMFGGNFAPRSWAFCNGQLLSIAQNDALFSILGTTYGGDGRTTFGLPDLRGRVAISAGTGPGLSTKKLGQRSGIEYVNLNSLQIPSHNHTNTVTSTGGTVVALASTTATNNDPTNNYWSNLSVGPVSGGPYDTSADTTMASDAVQITNLGAAVTIGNTGASAAHTNMQPSLVSSYVICMFGTYPSRS